MSAGLGELAAIGTAVSWGISNQVQSVVARMMGSTGVTLLRMPYQIAFLAFLCFIMQADISFSSQNFLLLIVSGVLGICCCDYALYRSITIIGPAMAVLLLSMSAGFTALFGWIFLSEIMPFQAVAGIVTTLLGIGWVVTEHSASTLLPGQEVPEGKVLLLGVALAASAAVCLAASFIFLKLAMQNSVDPLWASFVRLCGGAAVLWAVGLVRGWIPAVGSGLRRYPRIYWMLFFSCGCGSLGMWFSSLAMNMAPVGIAATLIGLQPIMVTIIGALWYRRAPSLRTVSGIVIAFCGTALVCLR